MKINQPLSYKNPPNLVKGSAQVRRQVRRTQFLLFPTVMYTHLTSPNLYVKIIHTRVRIHTPACALVISVGEFTPKRSARLGVIVNRN